MIEYCYNESPETTKQRIADALQAALSRLIGLDAPSEAMMLEHAFVVEREGGLDYMWGSEEKQTLLISTRAMATEADGVTIETHGD